MIPCSGTIKASDINTELGRSGSYNFRIGNADERSLAGKPSGLIKFSDFACKSVGFDLGVGYTSGFNETYIGFQNMGGLERAKIGSIKGQFPSPYFAAGSVNNSVGFYFHALCYQDSSHGGGFYFGCNKDSPNGYLSESQAVWPWANPVVTLTDSSGQKLVMTTYRQGRMYFSASPSAASIKSWMSARRNTTVKVSITG